jgi:hypothetical protein
MSRDPAKLKAYVDEVDRAIQTAGETVLQYVIFSDSVVISSVNDDEESFLSLVRACATLFAEFLQKGIPIRGAISHGEFTRSANKNGSFVAGQPIVEAYDYEGRQDWVGILLCPSTMRKQGATAQRFRRPGRDEIKPGFDLKRLDLPTLLGYSERIPFHKEEGADYFYHAGYAVLPTGEGVTFRNILEKLEKAVDSLKAIRLVAPGPKEQLKIQHAINWLIDDVLKGNDGWENTVNKIWQHPELVRS